MAIFSKHTVLIRVKVDLELKPKNAGGENTSCTAYLSSTRQYVHAHTHTHTSGQFSKANPLHVLEDDRKLKNLEETRIDMGAHKQ